MPTNPTSTARPLPAFGLSFPDAALADDRDALIHRYLPLVNKVVRQLMTRLPNCADFEELHSIGTMGLLAAIDRYDAKQSHTFAGYAQMRIRGAVLDELRRMDSLPRSRRSQLRHIQEVISTLEQKHGRAPYDTEIAEALGVTPAELETLQARVRPASVVSLDSTLPVGGAAGDGSEVNFHETVADERITPVFENIERKEMVNLLGTVLESMPERQRDVLVMYYYEGLRLGEIAKVFGVTEARICQIHAQALVGMRQRLKQID